MNMITIPSDNEGWKKAMYHEKCVCGHELYLHAFTMSFAVRKPDENYTELRTSQCTRCDYDKENEKFLCDGFVKA